MTWFTPPIVFSDGAILTAAQLNSTINTIAAGTVGVANGALGTTAAVSGAIPYGTSTTTAAWSGLLTQFGPMYGGGAAGAPVATAAMTNGQVLIGSTGAAPVPASLTAGAGITLTPGAGTLTIAAAGLSGLSSIQYVRKTADGTAVNNSTVLVNDSVLLAALAANEVVSFRLVLFYSSNGTAHIKFAFTVPAGATLIWNDAVPGNNLDVEVSGTAAQYSGSGALRLSALLMGTVVNGANAGNLQLQMAQAVANVSDTKVLANSHLVVYRV